MTDEKGKSYKMTARCTNCGHTWTASIPWGVPTSDLQCACPECGCETVYFGRGWGFGITRGHLTLSQSAASAK